MAPQNELFPSTTIAPAASPVGGRDLFPTDLEDPLRQSLEQAAKTPNPDRLFDLRLKTGLPASVISRHQQEIEQDVARSDFDPAAFRASPKLAEWLKDPVAAAAARDDLTTLQSLEHTLTFGESILRGLNLVKSEFGGRFPEAVAGLVGNESARRTFAAEGQRYETEAALYGRRMSVTEIRGPWDLAQYLKETVGEQIPMMAPALAGGVAGAATTVGAFIGAAIPSFIQNTGDVQSSVDQIDPNAKASAAVFLGGAVVAALDTALPGHVGSRLVATFGRETAEQIAKKALLTPVKTSWLWSTAKGAIAGMRTEGLTEALQEAVGNIAAAAGTGTPVDWSQTWSQMVEAGAAGAVMGGGIEGVTAGAEARHVNAQVAASQQQVAFFDALGKGVQDSKLAATVPAALQEFLQRATKDGPVEHVYAPVDAFEQYWQGKGINPAIIAQELTGRADALEQARLSGADLQIPTATYATKLAGTEHHAFFAKELKLDPTTLNAREAEELQQRVADLADQVQADEPPTSPNEEIYSRVYDQAVAAGAKPDVAEGWAVLYASRYPQRAARLGVEPMALFEQKPPPAITSETPAAPAEAPVEIPPSEGSPHETPAQFATRRRAQYAALTNQVVRDAVRQDASVDVAAIRAEVEGRLGALEEGKQQQVETGNDPKALLRAIAKAGGLWFEKHTGAYQGEIEHLMEGRDIAAVKAGTGRIVHNAGRATWGGVPGVFNESGQTPDHMVETLTRNGGPGFAHITDINDLLAALEKALATGAESIDTSRLPGSAELRDVGIQLGRQWWNQGAGEFTQRGAGAEARLRALEGSRTIAAARRPPFPFISTADAERLFRAASQEVSHVEAIPLQHVVATQDFVFPDTAVQYATGERRPHPSRDRPIALHLGERYYLIDGTHRAAAAWASGETVIDAYVRNVDPGQLEGEEPTEFFQEEPDAVKGAFSPATNTIRLIAGKADLSTFLHESGHAFLEELLDDATIDFGATPTREQQQLRTDAETTLRWFGFTGSIEEWRALPLEGRRAHHEQFARGFEAYLMQGRAPSVELQGVFARFRTWLVGVYRTIKALRVDITPEIRGVMDRLLASDDAIAAAEADSGITPIFSDAADAGLDEASFDAYKQRFQNARQAAIKELDSKLMADFRREREAWWRGERDITRAAVITELMGQPAFVAQSVIRTGKMPDGSIPSFGDGRPIKLSKADLVAQYGPDMLRQLPKPYLYAVEGGLPVETVAELTGFPSGDALLKALINTPRIDQVIDSETDTRMHERHGDMLSEELNLRDAAEGAVNTQRLDVVLEELRLLQAKAATRAASVPRALLDQSAQTQIARTTVRNLKPGLFLVAAQRAGLRAFELAGAGSYTEAVTAKQQEAFSLALYRAARDAKETSEQWRRALQNYDTNSGTRSRIGKAGGDFLDQIDGILERYEFTKLTLKALDRRESLRKFVGKLERQGLPVDIPEDVLDDARRVNWKELSVDELHGVYDAVQQIAHLARLKNKLLKIAKQREFAEVTNELTTSIRDHGTKRAVGQETRLPSQATGKLLEGGFAAHRKIASLAREMDGFKDGGAVWEYIIRPLNEAADREAEMQAASTKALGDLFDIYTPAERARQYRKEYLPALGDASDPKASLSKAGRLMVALNWGNETNRQRLRDGRGWSEGQVQAILDTLDKRDWQFVQSVWDYVDTFWPAIAAKQERVVGVAPQKVEASPVFTRYGEHRGGYFPIKFEGELAPGPAAHQDAEMAHLAQAAAYAGATTKRGHTKERAEGEVRLPVRLDYGVIFEHVGQVIHDLTHHEALVDVGRVLRNEDVAKAIYETQGDQVYRQFKNTLRDVAFGQEPARDFVEKVVNHLRTGSTVVGLGWRFTTALLQPVGLTQSMVRIGPKWVGRGLAEWFGTPQRMQKKVDWIYEQSTFMRTRGLTMNREINEIRNRVGVDTGRLSGWVDEALRDVSAGHVTKQAIADTYFSLIQKMQLVADVPTWLGQYEKSMADPANLKEDGTIDEARVVALADQAVIDAQGSGTVKDLASVQRGSAYLKLFTNFYSFFNVTYNLWVESKREAQSRRTSASIAKLAADYLLLFAAPATIGSLMRDALKGEDDPDSYVVNAIKEQVSYILSTMLLTRELAGSIQGYDYTGPAGNRAIVNLSKLLKDVTAAAEAQDLGKITKTGMRSGVEAAGAIFHLPLGQVRQSLEGIVALMEGRTQNPAAVLVGPPPAAK